MRIKKPNSQQGFKLFFFLLRLRWEGLVRLFPRTHRKRPGCGELPVCHDVLREKSRFGIAETQHDSAVSVEQKQATFFSVTFASLSSQAVCLSDVCLPRGKYRVESVWAPQSWRLIARQRLSEPLRCTIGMVVDVSDRHGRCVKRMAFDVDPWATSSVHLETQACKSLCGALHLERDSQLGCRGGVPSASAGLAHVNFETDLVFECRDAWTLELARVDDD